MSRGTYPSNLFRIPDHPDKWHFRWADYWELLALSSPDNEFSAADFSPLIKPGRDIQLDSDESITQNEPSTLSDRWERRLNDFLSLLRYRMNYFADFYPFTIESETLTLKTNLSDKHYFYLYFLFASNLTYFQQQQTTLTNAFEDVALKVMSRILPSGTEVHIFGTSRQGGRYNGNTWQRVCQLADDLRTSIICSERAFQGNRSGDAGIDIVAWYPLPDAAPGIPVYFSQCACSVESWEEKQMSISRDKWDGRLRFLTPFSACMCIPFSFRDSTGMWDNDDSIVKTLLLDRDRIIALLYDDFAFSSSSTLQLVQQLTNLKI
ncbi:MAG: hypothetical protein K0R55_2747 [Sporomusa sp.]|jgi:hypothetical protein|nr:hypothetical protein [Sporomusa sp.]